MSPRTPENTIELHVAHSGLGWDYGIWLGTNLNKGWTIECDMEDGAFNGALTPAGKDPMLHFQVREDAEGNSTFTLQADAHAVWDPEKRQLTVGHVP